MQVHAQAHRCMLQVQYCLSILDDSCLSYRPLSHNPESIGWQMMLAGMLCIPQEGACPLEASHTGAATHRACPCTLAGAPCALAACRASWVGGLPGTAGACPGERGPCGRDAACPVADASPVAALPQRAGVDPAVAARAAVAQGLQSPDWPAGHRSSHSWPDCLQQMACPGVSRGLSRGCMLGNAILCQTPGKAWMGLEGWLLRRACTDFALLQAGHRPHLTNTTACKRPVRCSANVRLKLMIILAVCSR